MNGMHPDKPWLALGPRPVSLADAHPQWWTAFTLSRWNRQIGGVAKNAQASVEDCCQSPESLAAGRDTGTLTQILARISHQPPAADADLTAAAALNAAKVLDVPASTPARPDSRSPCPCRPLRALASCPGEKCRPDGWSSQDIVDDPRNAIATRERADWGDAAIADYLTPGVLTFPAKANKAEPNQHHRLILPLSRGRRESVQQSETNKASALCSSPVSALLAISKFASPSHAV